ncbi:MULTISPECIES: M42 family metallopeptidase [Thermoactinomyces]|jgi:putative aminopeptidase FrvX|uniref:M42 family metallopeptidase n=1 Tax=Thermoactinomyces TaxID=2023 RepID=UPI0007A0C9B9|nr:MULTISPECIES: M42 family metallopeptidase [Thermoactinomyces]KYQ86647.1 peptidase M42 [Thermoactinomyces sp. AS95]MBI0386557.1 M42 family metallopeptidase [Thermoactinomyces sp. CICC 24227]QCV54868.1 M42 family peptidase [Thermoactinomyces vulgaris]
MNFPEEQVLTTLVELMQIQSPSGHTDHAIEYVTRRLTKAGMQPVFTNKGGVLVTIKGENDTQHRFVTAHVDTLGAMVKEIKEDGRLKLSKIGGFGWFSVDGAYCFVETRKGKVFTGTILASHTSVHVYHDAEKQERSDENMEVRLDVRAGSREEIEALGIRVGDFVSFDPSVVQTDTGFVKARHLDDKASVAVMLELLKHLKESGAKLPYTTHFYFSNFEEVGFGANAGIPVPVCEYVSVDMGATGEGQASDEFSVSICAKDGSGPYHYGLTNHLIRLAEEHHIAYQVDIYPHYASDASAAVRAGYDVKHALIGPGVDASHAYERTHRDALENTYLLLYHYLLSNMA